jgi:hypothetical protein
VSRKEVAELRATLQEMRQQDSLTALVRQSIEGQVAFNSMMIDLVREIRDDIKTLIGKLP